VARARADLFTGNFQAAKRRGLALIADPATTSGVLLDMLVVTACAELRLAEHDAARGTFATALSIARQTNHFRPFAMMPYDDLDELLATAAGHSLTEPGIPRLDRQVFGEPSHQVTLTDRERLVLEHLRTEQPLAAIAADLFISINTLKTHVRSVYRKFGTSNRADTVAAALRHGLLVSD
jgi:LuxR family maltose regulon positive regulatory protein